MENVQRLLVRRGTSFESAFATTPLCCPSRVSFLRGQYAHNHGVLDNKNSPRQPGGYEGFRELGLQDSTAGTWLDDVGYEPFYAGKLLNGYENQRYVPPGWDEWYAFSGHPHWTHYEVNENGELRTYRQADKHETYYLRNRAEAFVRDHAQGGVAVVRHGRHPRAAQPAHQGTGVPRLLRPREDADAAQPQRGGRHRQAQVGTKTAAHGPFQLLEERASGQLQTGGDGEYLGRPAEVSQECGRYGRILRRSPTRLLPPRGGVCRSLGRRGSCWLRFLASYSQVWT